MRGCRNKDQIGMVQRDPFDRSQTHSENFVLYPDDDYVLQNE